MILGLFMLGSCSDDEFDKSSNVKEGVPVKLTLSMSTSELQQITTKAALSSVDFNAVYDVYVFIYNKDHQLEAKQDFTYTPAKTSGSVTSGNTGLSYDYTLNIPFNSDEIKLKKGHRYTVNGTYTQYLSGKPTIYWYVSDLTKVTNEITHK